MGTERTTVRLDDTLLRAAKQRALQEETTVTALITRGLRRELEQSRDAERRAAVMPPPMDGGAYLASLAIEHSATPVSFDRGFSRFPGLAWIDPADRAGLAMLTG